MPLDLFSSNSSKEQVQSCDTKRKHIAANGNEFTIENILRNRYEKQAKLLSEKIRVISDKTFSGIVEIGEKRMNKIGFPTANVQCDIFNIKNGFYLSQITVNDVQYRGLAFIKKENNLAEIYIFNFNKNIYGYKITVKILNFISVLYELDKISLHEQFEKNIQVAERNF